MTMDSCNDGCKIQSSIPKWLSETPSPVWTTCLPYPSDLFVPENDSNDTENIRELPCEHLPGFDMCKTETDRRQLKLAHEAIAWLESGTSNMSLPATNCIEVDNIFKLFAWMYQDDGALECPGDSCQTFKMTLIASGRIPLEKKLKNLTSLVKGSDEAQKLVCNICQFIRHSGCEDPTLLLLCFNNLTKLVRDERFWQMALLTCRDNANACADCLIKVLGKGIMETADKDGQRITLIRALSTFSVRLAEFIRVMAPVLSPSTIRHGSAAMAQSLGVIFQFCDSSSTKADCQLRVAGNSGAHRLIIAWMGLLSHLPCGHICTCDGPGHCSKEILLGLEPLEENNTGWGPMALLRCFIIAQTEPHELLTQSGVLGFFQEGGNTTPTKGTLFQNKLILSSSLASVQYVSIPWMLMHLTGAYHKLVGNLMQPNANMGLLLVESVGNCLGGVLSSSSTFSSALADALKGCIHPVSVCREAWVIGTVKFFCQLVKRGNKQPSAFLRRFVGDALLHSSPDGERGIMSLHYIVDDYRDVCTALCNAVERMIVYCVTDRHLAHAVWEPLAEYAELQQYEQNHTQPKLHPATVRLAWLCIRLLGNAIDISISPFAKRELMECAIRLATAEPQEISCHDPKVGEKRQSNGDCCSRENPGHVIETDFSGFVVAAAAVDGALSIYKDSSTHLADRQWLAGGLLRVCLKSPAGSLPAQALRLIFQCLGDDLQSLGITSEAMAVRGKSSDNKISVQHLLLLVRLVGKLGSICGCAELRNGGHVASRDHPPPTSLPKHIKDECANIIQEGLESNHWLVRKESMDAVVRMLRAVENEFAALLTARVPQSCIADLKQKLVKQCSSSPFIDMASYDEGSLSNAVKEVLQLRQYYYPHLHSSTNHHPVNVSYQSCETVVSAEVGTPLSVLIPELTSLEANQPSAILKSKLTLLARHTS